MRPAEEKGKCRNYYLQKKIKVNLSSISRKKILFVSESAFPDVTIFLS